MPNVLVVNCTPHETRVALLEAGRVAEIYLERRRDSGLVGNIYKGRVIRVLPGMHAAFVDIGLERAAFLYVGDVVDDTRRRSPVASEAPGRGRTESISVPPGGVTPVDATPAEQRADDGAVRGSPGASGQSAQERLTTTSQAPDGDTMDTAGSDSLAPGTATAGTMTSGAYAESRALAGARSIQSLLHEGQEIIVQVSKEPIGTKGARVTSHVSIAGRHLVYMPEIEHVGISRRIQDEEERTRLRGILEALVPHGGGFVARTAAEGRTPEELRADLEFLRQVYNDILARVESGPAPMTLYDDLDLILRAARDLVTPELTKIVVDDADERARLTRFMSRFMPRFADRVELHEGPEPIFEAYGVEIEIQRALGRKVWLESGGYLIIDQTEALTSIDVNTGRFVGKRNLEETILRTNLEAVTEIVRQLRLRNIGGIIIIDLIDMDKPANRERVHAALAQALQSDRVRSNILEISSLGLVEMTRKRVRDSLLRTVSEPCFYCDGAGILKSRTAIAFEVYRALLRAADTLPIGDVAIRVHPRVADWLGEEEAGLVAELEERLGRAVRVVSRPDYHLERFEIGAVSPVGPVDPPPRHS